MNGDYKLLRQGGGRGAFAHVFVEVTPLAGPEHQVSVRVEANDPSTLLPEQVPTWFEAAIEGCRAGTLALEAAGIVQVVYQIEITALHTTLVDTQADAIAAAAFLAIAAAFQAGERFQLVFSERWHVMPI